MSKYFSGAFCALLFALATILTVDANATGRVVGGFDAQPGQFPYQISLRRNHKHTCGGSIISPNYILTAAHCVVKKGTTPHDAKNFTIVAGTHNRIAGGVLIQVKKITVHEGYVNFINDLALLELEENLVYSNKIQPIEMATEEVPSKEEIIISGWGLMERNGASLPIILQWTKVTSLTKLQCALKIPFYSNALICLDHPKGVGSCGGDSGGPATYNGKLVGVSGFVFVVCSSSRPDGYSKVSYHVDWIHAHMA